MPKGRGFYAEQDLTICQVFFHSETVIYIYLITKNGNLYQRRKLNPFVCLSNDSELFSMSII